MGYVRRPSGEVVLDPNEHAQDTIRLVFDLFDRFRTVGRVMRYLIEHDIRMPVRVSSGPHKGDLEWHRVNRASLHNLAPRIRLLIRELDAPHPLVLSLSPIALEQVFAWHSVQRRAAALASTRQLKMPRSGFFHFVDRKPIVLFVRHDNFSSINPNLAFAPDLSVIRSQH